MASTLSAKITEYNKKKKFVQTGKETEKLYPKTGIARDTETTRNSYALKDPNVVLSEAEKKKLMNWKPPKN